MFCDVSVSSGGSRTANYSTSFFSTAFYRDCDPLNRDSLLMENKFKQKLAQK